MSIMQTDWRQRHLACQEQGTHSGKKYPWILPADAWADSLWSGVRDRLLAYIDEHKVEHHTGVNNLNSSWVLCANLYFPFGEEYGRPLLASFLSETLRHDVEDVIAVELEYAEKHPLDPQSLLGESDEGQRGANQTSPDVAFLVKTGVGRGLILTESKLTEHHFYQCSGRKKKAKNPDPKLCLDWPTLQEDAAGTCWQKQWATAGRKNRLYWDWIRLSEEGKQVLRRCPAASDGYQLFRQQALAEALATKGGYELVVSAVAFDQRNTELTACLRTTGLDNFSRDWGRLFAGNARFTTWTHQDWVAWVRRHDTTGLWRDWLCYVEDRYGYV
jgi:hypothetical protein